MTDPYQAPGPGIQTIAEEDPRVGSALDALARSSQARTVFQYLEDYLVGRQKQLDREMFQALEAGRSIKHFVHQKHEVQLFIRNLEQHIKSGVAAARILEPMMQRNEEDASN